MADLEQKINIKLKERQEIFNQVFQQDMRQYIISGIIPVMKSSSKKNYYEMINNIGNNVLMYGIYRQ